MKYTFESQHEINALEKKLEASQVYISVIAKNRLLLCDDLFRALIQEWHLLMMLAKAGKVDEEIDIEDFSRKTFYYEDVEFVEGLYHVVKYDAFKICDGMFIGEMGYYEIMPLIEEYLRNFKDEYLNSLKSY